MNPFIFLPGWEKRKQLELELLEKIKLAEIDQKIAEKFKRAETQNYDYECEWHRRKEKLELELNKIETKIEALKTWQTEKEEQVKILITEKNNRIEYLEKMVNTLINQDRRPMVVAPEIIVK